MRPYQGPDRIAVLCLSHSYFERETDYQQRARHRAASRSLWIPDARRPCAHGVLQSYGAILEVNHDIFRRSHL